MNPNPPMVAPPSEPTALRRGWTTGACATAAAKAAFTALLGGDFPDPVAIRLPGGEQPSFALAAHSQGGDVASASIIKDAGDDPDVTHQACVTATLRRLSAGEGVRFRAGKGVGVVTKPGLPLAVGEPAINPMPRQMMCAAMEEVALQYGVTADVEIEISVADGERIAEKTLNPRLGILGGISILGTTGIVIPYSCSAWIHSIHRGIDVARAMGISHIAGATGNSSEKAVQKLYNLPEEALIDMGDFVGGMLKYLRQHPVSQVTIAGGFAKMTKLAQGKLDLHSGRSQVDLDFLADLALKAGLDAQSVSQIAATHSAQHALELAGARAASLAEQVAEQAQKTACQILAGSGIALDLLIFTRDGQLLAKAS